MNDNTKAEIQSLASRAAQLSQEAELAFAARNFAMGKALMKEAVDARRNCQDLIMCDTSGKEQILETLLPFTKDKTVPFKKKKYQYADKLIGYQKKDLETKKADIEYFIDSNRLLAAVLAVFGVIVSDWVSVSVWISEDFRIYGSVGVTVFFASLSIFTFFSIGEKVSWLHIIKIALAQNSHK